MGVSDGSLPHASDISKTGDAGKNIDGLKNQAGGGWRGKAFGYLHFRGLWRNTKEKKGAGGLPAPVPREWRGNSWHKCQVGQIRGSKRRRGRAKQERRCAAKQQGEKYSRNHS